MSQVSVDGPRWLASDVQIELDPETALRKKAARMWRFHTVVVPWYRVGGFLLLIGAVSAADRLAPGTLSGIGLGPLAGGLLAYTLISWAALRAWYSSESRLDLALVFLMTDVVVLAVVIYATGGNTSPFLPLLLIRVADQGFIAFRRSVFAGHLGAGSYAAVILYMGLVDGAAVSWQVEAAKTTVLYLASMFISFTSLTAERLRRRAASLLGLATGLITQLEQKSAALEESRARAEEANRLKSDFLANMSHELRTPLHAVIGVTDVLRNSTLSPEQRDWIETIGTSADHLLEVIGGILDFSRIEAGRLSLEHAPFSVQGAVEHVGRLLSARAARKGIALAWEIQPELPPILVGDAVRVRQVLTNLTANAVKFTDGGSVRISARPIGGDETTTVIRFEVADTGIGIPAEAGARLFDPFEQADGSPTRRYDGSGLGLAICKRLADMMGGRIGFRSQPGAGSTFWFEVPLARDRGTPWEAARGIIAAAGAAATGTRANTEPAKPVGGLAPEPRIPPSSTRADVADPVPTPRILVVEDNYINQKVAMGLLRRIGHRADVAASGAEAVEATRGRRYGLILMDLQMPGMDGFEAAASIRSRDGTGSHTPIVAMTANATTAGRERCLASGMDDYLSKPVRLEELRGVVNRWLGESA